MLLGLEDLFLFGPGDAICWSRLRDRSRKRRDDRTGDRIHAWWSTPKDWRPEQGAVLFCHGNGFVSVIRGQALSHWINEMNLAVLLFDYPGFGLSSGQPSEGGCYAAGDAAYDWLRIQKVPGPHIIL